MQDLGTLGGFGSAGFGINNAGHVTGWAGTPSGNGNAFLWDGTTMQDLGSLGGPQTIGRSINNLGQVVGWGHTPSLAGRAFLWNGSILIDLNDFAGGTGWVLMDAFSINDAGQIVGMGLYNGQMTGFLMTPSAVPEPGTWALAGLGLLAAVWRGRRAAKSR
jgi:probable HAF family extracellular repeat protein